ncbi:MAG: SGNH/GDSL hydrolase family protein [Oscillospiraceae bacterium]|nr:SGNH/GDSL hydrolase family protein [Oscillospiraceae bacterium]
MNANQGFYKYKNDTYPKIFDNGYITDTLVRLKNNQNGYSYIASRAGDMIKSVTKNLADASQAQASGSNYSTTVDSDGIITASSINDKYWNVNGSPSGDIRFRINKACDLKIVLDHISGAVASEDGTEKAMGTRIALWKGNVHNVDNLVLQSFAHAFPTNNAYSVFVFKITQEHIDLGVNEFEICLWSNGSSKKSMFNEFKGRICVEYDDGTKDYEYTQHKETTKVCDNHGHCYCMTYENGSVFSENGYEISVDYPKSLFAMKFRSVIDRVQNLDGADTGSENRIVHFFGDSITAGSGAEQLYHMWLSRYTGFKCVNWGIGGNGYLREDFATAYTGNGKEGRGDITKHEGNNTIIKMMQSVGDFENCFIFAGTNDYGSAFDIDEFRTAVRDTLDYAQTKASRIMVLTPLRRPNFDNINSVGHKLHEYSGIILEECMARGIPCVDGFELGINPMNSQCKSWYYSEKDGLHPSDNGHKFIAGWILDKFKAVFKV